MLNRIKGHERGAETVRTIVRTCREIGIQVLTLYAFSTENWQRSRAEIAALMTLLQNFLESERKELMDNNIRLDTIGQIERLPETVQKTLQTTMTLTERNDAMRLVLALSYGSRDEIVRMVQTIAKKTKAGEIDPDTISPELVSEHLYTRHMPEPDLLIRTSGEMRVSNFMLWQIAYSEIHVTDVLWPDFKEAHLFGAIRGFQKRDRRYGTSGSE